VRGIGPPVVREPQQQDLGDLGVRLLEIGEVLEAREPVLPRGVERYRDQLVVARAVVLGHREHADHVRPRDVPALDAAAEHDDVERVAVGRERARDHAVVDREREVVDLARAAVVAIHLPAQLAVVGDLELRRRAGRDLDDGVHGAARVLGRITIGVVLRTHDRVVIGSARLGGDRRTAHHVAPRDARTRPEQHHEQDQVLHTLTTTSSPAILPGHDLGHRA
jgi:hypothetical protein